MLPVTSVSIVVGRKRLILPLQVDWAQRYDACHKILPRLSPSGVQQFINSITFSESAVDGIALENRVEIVNRALRFARQQDAALKKKESPRKTGLYVHYIVLAAIILGGWSMIFRLSVNDWTYRQID